MKLQIGDNLPEFSLFDQNNNRISIRDYLGKPTILFFYPKDNTPICTIEACAFEKNYSKFENLDAKIFGISADSVASHQKFANKYDLKYSLLSDEHRVVENIFGIKKLFFGIIKERITLIFDKNHKLIHKITSQLDGQKHIKEALMVLSNNHLK